MTPQHPVMHNARQKCRLVDHLLKLAERPTGVNADDVQGFTLHNTRTRLCDMVRRGQLVRVRCTPKHIRYFRTQEAADRYANAVLQHHHSERRPPPAPAAVAKAETRRGRAAEGPAINPAEHAVALQPYASSQVVAGVRITKGHEPRGLLAGHAPPDRPLPLRPGALDYQRHMAKYRPPMGAE